ncbi:DUF6916 family protein [Sandaracinus amylolyticus]|uniref:DUF6916 domain-containing protein n=1 Tax=Sandaracinus amylolyticus TaxID=927083 RepID=A0A0F6SFX6_9BACT|nr:hypothetical protein [Sandaracinus amylolyticus]AKF07709.1 hypothetical protein DB32_004858 [Sandaracinus amylolyticus]
MSERLDVSRYRALEGREFTLAPTSDDERWTLSLVLESVRDLGTRDGLSCYSLVFAQREGQSYAPQGTHRLTCSELGEQVLLVVPIGPGPGARMRYEVIFN